MPDTASSPIVRLGSGATITTLVTPEGSNGAFSLYRWDLTETTRGPSEHFHRSFAESFILLSGEVAFYDGRGWRDVTIGKRCTPERARCMPCGKPMTSRRRS